MLPLDLLLNFPATVPDRLRLIQCVYEWNERQLGRVLGVSQGTVSRWRNGRSIPSRERAARIESLADRAFGRAWDPLLADDVPPLQYRCSFARVQNNPALAEQDLAEALADLRASSHVDPPVGLNVTMLWESGCIPSSGHSRAQWPHASRIVIRLLTAPLTVCGDRAHFFVDNPASPRLCVILVSDAIPEAQQTQVGLDELYCHLPPLLANLPGQPGRPASSIIN